SSSSITTVASVAINPATPSTVFAALLLGLSDGALFKSTDGGDSWNQAGSNTNGADFTNIAIDPRNPATMYASQNHLVGGATTSTTIVKSTDSGLTWGPAGNGLSSAHVYTIAIDPQNTSNVYAGTVNGLFKSTDGAATWVLTEAVHNAISISI